MSSMQLRLFSTWGARERSRQAGRQPGRQAARRTGACYTRHAVVRPARSQLARGKRKYALALTRACRVVCVLLAPLEAHGVLQQLELVLVAALGGGVLGPQHARAVGLGALGDGLAQLRQQRRGGRGRGVHGAAHAHAQRHHERGVVHAHDLGGGRRRAAGGRRRRRRLIHSAHAGGRRAPPLLAWRSWWRCVSLGGWQVLPAGLSARRTTAILGARSSVSTRKVPKARQGEATHVRLVRHDEVVHGVGGHEVRPPQLDALACPSQT